MNLSGEQRRAVDAGPVDMAISAGAGSGKTRVLTTRFVHAVLGRDPYKTLAPGQILTVTFTERAAGEIAERIRGALVKEGAMAQARHVEEAWISTIHGMCARILRQHAFDAGLDPRFGIATEVECGILAREAFDDVARTRLAAGDPALTIMLETLGVDEVLGAVRSVYAEARSRGCGAQGFECLDDARIRVEVDRVARDLAALGEDMCTACDSTSKRVQGNIACLNAVAEFASTVAMADLETIEAGLRAPGSLTRSGRDEVHDGLVEAARDRIGELDLLLAQICARPYEKVLTELVAGFDAAYGNLKAERSLLDFEDLQVCVADLFERRPDIAAGYRRRFRMVMIDEFQDTNALQMKIAAGIADGDLCTVGDDKQSIYSFRHADVEVFRRRQSESGLSLRLADNYRSHPDLLAFFNGVFSRPVMFGDDLMPLVPGVRPLDADGWPDGIQRAQVLFVSRGQDAGVSAIQAEAIAVADELTSLRQRGVPQHEMVVLLRKMKDAAEVFETELRRRGFEVFIASGGTYFEAVETRELIAVLRLADNAFDDEAALAVLAGRFTGVSDDGLYALKSATVTGEALWHSARRAGDLEISRADRSVIERTVDAIDWMRANRGALPLSELLLGVCERTDFDLALFASGVGGERAWANALKLMRMADEFEASSHADIGSFLDYLAVREQHVASEQQATVAGEHSRSVRIMSIHASKGLEFPVVVVASCSGTTLHGGLVRMGDLGGSLALGLRFPTPAGDSRTQKTWVYDKLESLQRAKDAEEVKRLLYVACTRAEKGLILCLSTDPEKEAVGDAPPDLFRVALGMTDTVPETRRVQLRNDAIADVRSVRIEEGSVDAPPVEVPVVTCEEPGPLQPLAPAPSPMPSAPISVSYSGLSSYRTCGLRFYAESVLRLPRKVRLDRTPPAVDPLAFGTVFHEAMRRLHGAHPLDDQGMRELARSSHIPAIGIDRLVSAVQAYRSSRLAASVFSAERRIAECPICVPIGESVLVGSIDLIAWSGKTALVVDYKTGETALSDEEARARYRLQAECYALAVLAGGASSVSVCFFEPERGGRQTRYEFSPQDEGTLREEIERDLTRMCSEGYRPLDAYDESVCEACAAFGSLCPITRDAG